MHFELVGDITDVETIAGGRGIRTRLDNQTILGLTMKRHTSRDRFVLCMRNDGSEDLEPRKVYQVLDDREADREGYLRVIDESGEDYLYPSEYFVDVKLPANVSKQLLSPSRTHVRSQVRLSRRSGTRLRAGRG
jgi:hypothetical protein